MTSANEIAEIMWYPDCLSVCLAVCRISQKVTDGVTDLNQILWNDRSSSRTNRLNFGTDPYPGLDPGWIFHFFNMALNRITQKIVNKCSWNFWEDSFRISNIGKILGQIRINFSTFSAVRGRFYSIDLNRITQIVVIECSWNFGSVGLQMRKIIG